MEVRIIGGLVQGAGLELPRLRTTSARGGLGLRPFLRRFRETEIGVSVTLAQCFVRFDSRRISRFGPGTHFPASLRRCPTFRYLRLRHYLVPRYYQISMRQLTQKGGDWRSNQARSRAAHSLWPFLSATARGVPAGPHLSRSAPPARSTATTSAWPCSQAAARGVVPAASGVLGS